MSNAALGTVFVTSASCGLGEATAQWHCLRITVPITHCDKAFQPRLGVMTRFGVLEDGEP